MSGLVAFSQVNELASPLRSHNLFWPSMHRSASQPKLGALSYVELCDLDVKTLARKQSWQFFREANLVLDTYACSILGSELNEPELSAWIQNACQKLLCSKGNDCVKMST